MAAIAASMEVSGASGSNPILPGLPPPAAEEVASAWSQVVAAAP